MTLKRKASFTMICSPRATSSYNASVVPVPFLTGDVIAIDETPRHLHSRTRKRFKNDRPEDQSVYDKTMQFLYSAQKQMKYGDSGLSPTSTQTDTYEPAHTLPTAPDPMQQTLQKFFQPLRTSTRTIAGTINKNVQNGAAFGTHDNSNFGSASSNMVAGSMDVDVEMSMDIDMSSDASSSSNDSEKRWVGGIGWM